MIKADKYLKQSIRKVLESGTWDSNPRPKWSDGTPAHSKFITQQVFNYDIFNDEFPINTLRNTALRGAFFDIEAIYIKQTNILEEMNPLIQPWWEDFYTHKVLKIVNSKLHLPGAPPQETQVVVCPKTYNKYVKEDFEVVESKTYLGHTYGHTVNKYKLMDKLLNGMEKDPFSRRHILSLWQEAQRIIDPKALTPCAFETLWSISEIIHNPTRVDTYVIRYVDLTLIQRSMDFIVTASINPAQYVMLGMMVCNHLTYKTGVQHYLRNFMHLVQNLHIYDRHIEFAEQLLKSESTGLEPKIELVCEPKDFYSHTIEDFKFTGLEGIKPLKSKLEIAV